MPTDPGDKEKEEKEHECVNPETGEDDCDPQGPSDDYPTENMDEDDTPFGTGD